MQGFQLSSTVSASAPKLTLPLRADQLCPKRIAAKGAFPTWRLVFELRPKRVTTEWDPRSSHREAVFARALGEQLLLSRVLQQLLSRDEVNPSRAWAAMSANAADTDVPQFSVVEVPGTGSSAEGGRGVKGGRDARPVSARSVFSWRGVYNTTYPDELLTVVLLNRFMCQSGSNLRHAEELLVQLMEVHLRANYNKSAPAYSRKAMRCNSSQDTADQLTMYLRECPRGATRVSHAPGSAGRRRPYFVPPPRRATLYVPPPWSDRVPRTLRNAAGYSDLNGDGYDDVDSFSCNEADPACREAMSDIGDYESELLAGDGGKAGEHKKGDQSPGESGGCAGCGGSAVARRDTRRSPLRTAPNDPNIALYAGNMLWLLLTRRAWLDRSLPPPVALAAELGEVKAAVLGGNASQQISRKPDSAIVGLLDAFDAVQYQQRIKESVPSVKKSKDGRGPARSPLMNWQGQFIPWHGGYALRARAEVAKARLRVARFGTVGSWAAGLLALCLYIYGAMCMPPGQQDGRQGNGAEAGPSCSDAPRAVLPPCNSSLAATIACAPQRVVASRGSRAAPDRRAALKGKLRPPPLASPARVPAAGDTAGIAGSGAGHGLRHLLPVQLGHHFLGSLQRNASALALACERVRARMVQRYVSSLGVDPTISNAATTRLGTVQPSRAQQSQARPLSARMVNGAEEAAGLRQRRGVGAITDSVQPSSRGSGGLGGTLRASGRGAGGRGAGSSGESSSGGARDAGDCVQADGISNEHGDVRRRSGPGRAMAGVTEGGCGDRVADTGGGGARHQPVGSENPPPGTHAAGTGSTSASGGMRPGGAASMGGFHGPHAGDANGGSVVPDSADVPVPRRSSGSGSDGGMGGLALVRQLLHLDSRCAAEAPSTLGSRSSVTARPLVGSTAHHGATATLQTHGTVAPRDVSERPVAVPMPGPITAPAQPVASSAPVSSLASSGPSRPAAAAGAAAASPVLAQQAGTTGDAPDDDDAKTCIVCYDAPRQHGFLHAGTVHMGVCDRCAESYRRAAVAAANPTGIRNAGTRTQVPLCPTCRQPVEALIRIFN